MEPRTEYRGNKECDKESIWGHLYAWLPFNWSGSVFSDYKRRNLDRKTIENRFEMEFQVI